MRDRKSDGEGLFFLVSHFLFKLLYLLMVCEAVCFKKTCSSGICVHDYSSTLGEAVAGGIMFSGSCLFHCCERKTTETQ